MHITFIDYSNLTRSKYFDTDTNYILWEYATGDIVTGIFSICSVKYK